MLYPVVTLSGRKYVDTFQVLAPGLSECIGIDLSEGWLVLTTPKPRARLDPHNSHYRETLVSFALWLEPHAMFAGVDIV